MRSVTFAVLLVLSAATFSQSVPPRFTMEWEALAAHIVERLDLQPGERFLAVAHPGLFDELIPYLRYEVMKAGAVDLGVIDVLAEPVPITWSEAVLREGGQAARATLAEMLEDVDASIMLPGANPSHPVYAAIQDNLHPGQLAGRKRAYDPFSLVAKRQCIYLTGTAAAPASRHRGNVPAGAAGG